MAQVLDAPLPRHQAFRLGVQPQIWKCGNVSCKNLVSDVDRKSKFKKYCSSDCRNYVNQKNRREREKKKKLPRLVEPRICQYCQKSFTPKKKRTTRFCSLKCNWRKLRGVTLEKFCINCKCSIKHSKNRQYCTRRCKLIHYHKDKLQSLGVKL